jgi:glycosyltransferase involved in cell wall biosynthesis
MRPLSNEKVPPTSHFAPVLTQQVELSEQLPAVVALNEQTGESYTRLQTLVRLHNQPIGLVELELDITELDPEQYAHEIWRALGPEINAHLRADGLPPLKTLDATGIAAATIPACVQARMDLHTKAPLVSVVVSTRDRTEMLAGCLHSLLALDYPRYEIVVIDNAPNTSATAEFITQYYQNNPLIRYVREDRPGLSWARNRGMLEAQGTIIAFTDDDVRVDAHWLTGLVQGFHRDPQVGCTTGMILPAELETPPQLWFEQFGGFPKGFTACLYDLDANRPANNPLYPYTVGQLGAGANMAVRADVLRQIGGFATALGAGTPAVGGEDLTLYFSVINAGYKLAYEPGALVHHLHRREYAAFRRQMFGYGTGLTVYLTGVVVANPRRALAILRRLPYGLFFALSPRSPKNNKKPPDYPHELTWLELQGMLYGPLAYLRGVLQSRRITRQTDDQKKIDAGTTDFHPIQICEIDIGQELSSIQPTLSRSGVPYTKAQILVRLHTQPVGTLEVPLSDQGLTAADLARHIWNELGNQINEILSCSGLPRIERLTEMGIAVLGTPVHIQERRDFLATAPFVSVVVPTRDRTDVLETCIEALLRLEYPDYEIIIVDNAPATSDTAKLLFGKYNDNPRVYYLREDRPGVSWARNCGLLHARGQIIAFTDDDVVVDRHWLTELVRGFAKGDRVACVTGLALPLEIETPSQGWFEQYGSFNVYRSFRSHIYDNDEHQPKDLRARLLYPFSTGIFGASAAVAFKTDFLRQVGGFDTALGPGCIAMGGEDLLLFYQTISQGYQLVQEPAAICYHKHRSDYAGLKKQIYAYGAGFTVYLQAAIHRNPSVLLKLVWRVPIGLLFILNPKGKKHSKKQVDYPTELNRLELRGLRDGAFLYIRSLWRRAAIRRVFGEPKIQPLYTARVAQQQARNKSVVATQLNENTEQGQCVSNPGYTIS